MAFENLFEVLAELPVAVIADDVTLSVLSGVVTILSSDTGSGKTLFESAHLADHSDEQVVVFVPRRFLAVNAAETVAELSGCEIGQEVGYAVGSQAGDRSCWSPETKLVFVTNGYALASGLINTATTFILDEVHETSMDLSIVRALLYRRMANGEKIKVLEMSATMNIARQAAYWRPVAKTATFEADGKTFDCEVRHRPAGRIEEEVMGLIEEGRRGILVFRPGVGEVKEMAEEIAKLAEKSGQTVEVAMIYGDMGYAERKSAVAAPKLGVVKVLVGTNVVESGANITWLDAGVSCGTGKENSVRPGTGATYLELVDLLRWRLSQQEGRVKRFCSGVFVLCSPKSFETREQATRPEIERLALTELVMHCATLGLRAHDLTFDYTPNPDKVVEAEVKLQRLGLIDADCMLTEAGKEISGLPIGPETGAMLWHAHQLGCLAAALPLAAVIEVGGLRKESRYSHNLNSSSDHLDALLAFRKAYLSHGKERREVNEGYNISFKRFEAASELLHDLERRLDLDADFDFNSIEAELRRVILAGSLDKLYRVGGYRGGVNSIKDRFASYSIGNGSVVSQYGNTLVIGDLRVITPKDKFKSPFTVLEKVTAVSLEDLKKVAKFRPEILVEQREPNVGWGGRSSGDYINLLLFGEHLVDQMLVHETIHMEREVEPDPFSGPPSVAEMSTGSLGDLLDAVLQARR